MDFSRLEDLMHAMKAHADVPPRRLCGKKYLKVALLLEFDSLRTQLPKIARVRKSVLHYTPAPGHHITSLRVGAGTPRAS